MRYAASEKLEIIRTVETSHLPVRRTLDKIGIPKTTFYAWLDRYAAGGFEALEDRKPRPRRIWNRIPDEIRDKVIERALDEPELSPREVAVAFTTSNGPLPTLSSITITAAITRAWTISPPLTSTSGEVIASGNGARRSSDAPSSRDANSTSTQQHELQPDGPDSP